MSYAFNKNLEERRYMSPKQTRYYVSFVDFWEDLLDL